MKNLLLLQQIAETEACVPIEDEPERIAQAVEDSITADFNSHFHWKGMLFAFSIVVFAAVVFVIPWMVGILKLITWIWIGG